MLASLMGRFSVLFWLLVASIAAPVVTPDGPIIRRVMAAALFLVMLSGLRVISRSRRELIVGFILGVPAVILSALGTGLDIKLAYLASLLLYLLFFGYLAVLILLHTLRQSRIDGETIYAAVDVYLLLALFWTMGYYALMVVSPGSFHFPETDPLGRVQEEQLAAGPDADFGHAEFADWREAHEQAQGALMYYSFVTLTTLGYGDIIPVGEVVRNLASAEAVLGQLFIAIFIARLVGLHITQASEHSG